MIDTIVFPWLLCNLQKQLLTAAWRAADGPEASMSIVRAADGPLVVRIAGNSFEDRCSAAEGLDAKGLIRHVGGSAGGIRANRFVRTVPVLVYDLTREGMSVAKKVAEEGATDALAE